MKKLFISQPMRGKSEEEIMAERADAIQAAKETLGEDVEVIDTYFGDFDGKALEFLGKSIMCLAQADIAYFARGWQDARGCKIEHDCAVAYNIHRIETVEPECACGPLSPNDSVDFGTAIALAKNGQKIARDGWNGRGMFVVYQKGYPQGIPCNKQTAEAWGMNEGELFVCNPYLQIKQVNGSHSMWVPSVGDVLAEDWHIFD